MCLCAGPCARSWRLKNEEDPVPGHEKHTASEQKHIVICWENDRDATWDWMEESQALLAGVKGPPNKERLPLGLNGRRDVFWVGCG
jgi:hypothetical protein